MVAKVGIGEVASETIGLIRHRAKYIGGMFFLLLAASAPMDWLLIQSGSIEYSSVFWGSVIFSMVVGTVIQVCVFNDFIKTLRGESSPLIPKGVAGKMFKTLLKECLVLLVAFIPFLVSMITIGFALIFLVPSVEESGGGFVIITSVITFLASLIGFGLPGVRLGAGIAAAAIGEKLSLKESWRMTKGHTFALVLFTAPMFIMQAICQTLFTPEQVEGTLITFGPGMVIAILFSSVAYWFAFAAFSVWYVRLKERDDHMV